MFTKSALHYDALYAFKDYEGAARAITAFVNDKAPGARTLLDVACGTGKHVETLRNDFEAEGLDLNADLLEIARSRCPGVRFHQADMTGFDLGRKFDVVTCLFSSIAYVKTLDRLDSAIAAMARALSPGGLLLVEPWFTPESYWVGNLVSNHVDQPELKISWMYLSERRDRLSVLDIFYQVGTPKGVRQFRETHELGLFTAGEYENAFRSAGLEPAHDPDGFFGRGLYWARAGG